MKQLFEFKHVHGDDKATEVSMSRLSDEIERVLIMFKPGSETDIDILHFKPGNTDISAPDYVVTATNPDHLGSYRKINNPLDADGDGDIDNNDSLIYRQLATSFASMKDLRP